VLQIRITLMLIRIGTDPTFHSDADPDPNFHFDPDLPLTFFQIHFGLMDLVPIGEAMRTAPIVLANRCALRHY
jgi:hypothetical protein